jgi:uncharacterized protein
MLFHVGGLLREPVGATRKHAVAPEPPVERGSVELVRLPGGVLVRFAGDVTIEAECSRCLGAFRYVETIEFEEIFVQQVDPGSGERVTADLGQDEDSFRVGLDHTIDITEAVRQYTEVAAAMQPLCRPDCPGLCAQCGQDLTVRTCSCDRAPADGRWAALADLKLFPNG